MLVYERGRRGRQGLTSPSRGGAPRKSGIREAGGNALPGRGASRPCWDRRNRLWSVSLGEAMWCACIEPDMSTRDMSGHSIERVPINPLGIHGYILFTFRQHSLEPLLVH